MYKAMGTIRGLFWAYKRERTERSNLRVCSNLPVSPIRQLYSIWTRGHDLQLIIR